MADDNAELSNAKPLFLRNILATRPVRTYWYTALKPVGRSYPGVAMDNWSRDSLLMFSLPSDGFPVSDPPSCDTCGEFWYRYEMGFFHEGTQAPWYARPTAERDEGA